MKKRYILCDKCGKKIYFGEKVYHNEDFGGTYCSVKCYAEDMVCISTLTEEFAKDNYRTVYDDNEIQKQIEELKQQKDRLDYEIATLQRILKHE